ncbi:hypothetical protein NPIL_311161 [Nephila pilipes]|uniref:Uncharacterized protein n=1 Tax=Nephila pilipes TaxID=299642 RepID=A0A8X6TL07_NEPPI|nr:hypothetical protein NPIL_311161 [Nephila pilipes]
MKSKFILKKFVFLVKSNVVLSSKTLCHGEISERTWVSFHQNNKKLCETTKDETRHKVVVTVARTSGKSHVHWCEVTMCQNFGTTQRIALNNNRGPKNNDSTAFKPIIENSDESLNRYKYSTVFEWDRSTLRPLPIASTIAATFHHRIRFDTPRASACHSLPVDP